MNPFDTHEVLNQAAPFADVNLFRCDAALREAVEREGAGWAIAGLDALGAELGRAEILDLARLANANGPHLVSHDRMGNRIDEVEFHPAWHQLMALLAKTCTKVRSVFFLPRTVLLTVFVPDRRHFPARRRNRSGAAS